MKRKTILWLGWVLLLVFPGLGFADCTELASWDRFILRQDGGVILFYLQNIYLGTVSLQDCKVLPSSKIDLLKSSVCSGDEILVDGKRCLIESLTINE